MDLDKIRTQLEAELQDVLAKSDRLGDHLRNKDRTIPADWSEMAQFMENDEVLEALEARSRERIDELGRAIDRIDAGTYASCSRCRKDISPKRLALLPTTSVCVSCAI